MQGQQANCLVTPLDHKTPAAAAQDVIVHQTLQGSIGRDRCILPIHCLRHFMVGQYIVPGIPGLRVLKHKTQNLCI